MTRASGFWSYVHDDDAAERGRIAELARDVVSQYKMITGDEVEILFLDRDELKWGDDWRLKVDSSLSSVVFFVPVLTPRYFRSSECRRELNFFLRRANELGIRDLILPIRYINFPDLESEDPKDDLIKLVRSFQWEDWTELRFLEAESSGYRLGVARMAQRMADSSKAVEGVDLTLPPTEGPPHEEEPDEPGFLDRVARAEEVMPRWNETMQEISHEVEEVGRILQSGTDEIAISDSNGKGFAGRVVAVNRAARELETPANQIEELSNTFSSQLNDVNSGIQALLERILIELQDDPNTTGDVTQFFGSIRELASSTEESLGHLDNFLDQMQGIEKNSRVMRPVIRRLKKSLTLLLEAREIARNWIQIIDDIDPPDTAT